MVLPPGASTPEEKAPPRIGAGKLELVISLLAKASSSPRLSRFTVASLPGSRGLAGC
jgi:hypothetical protein